MPPYTAVCQEESHAEGLPRRRTNGGIKIYQPNLRRPGGLRPTAQQPSDCRFGQPTVRLGSSGIMATVCVVESHRVESYQSVAVGSRRLDRRTDFVPPVNLRRPLNYYDSGRTTVEVYGHFGDKFFGDSHFGDGIRARNHSGENAMQFGDNFVCCLRLIHLPQHVGRRLDQSGSS